MKRKKLLLSVVLFLLAVIMLPSCSESPSAETASLRLCFKSKTEDRTLMPSSPENMNAAKYVVHITGPNDYDKSFETTSSELEITDTVIGNYQIDVVSVNKNGVNIAGGNISVWLYSGNNKFTVVLDTLLGYGRFKADFSWNPKQVVDPSVEVELINQNNEKVQIDSSAFSIDKSAGTYKLNETVLPSGSYTLHARIIDNEKIVSGLVEAVRINNDDITSGSLNFIIGNTSVSIVLGVRSNVSSPISATLTATPENVSAENIPDNVKFTITLGELPPEIKKEDISVTWYLEGEKIENSSGFELMHKPKPGVMRYDALLYHQYKGSIGSITINYKMPYYAE